MPKIERVINEVAKGKFFSAIDFKSAYHQVPLSDNDKPFTAFEACGKLYQFCRLPFGVTNGVAAFQRFIDDFIESNKLKGTIAYLDDVTIFGETKQQHDERLDAFLSAAKEWNLTLNMDKSVFSVKELSLLGHLVSHDCIRPNPEHLKPLIDLKPPENNKSLKRCLGMFSYYSKWIPNFSGKVRPLVKVVSFPLSDEPLQAFEQLKADLLNSCLGCIFENEPFTIECDASEFAIAAILSQRSRPVAFAHRTLNKHEARYLPVEKEAAAIIEAIRKWGYLLHGNSFKLITDQKSAAIYFSEEAQKQNKEQ